MSNWQRGYKTMRNFAAGGIVPTGYGPPIDPYTGEQTFDEGGTVLRDDSNAANRSGFTNYRINPPDANHRLPAFSSQTSGIGAYIDELNKRFQQSAGRGIANPWTTTGGTTDTTTRTTGGTNTGGTNTGGTNTGTSTDTGAVRHVGTNTGAETVVGGATTPVDDTEKEKEKEKEKTVTGSVEVVDPTTGQYRTWDTKTGDYATTGGATTPVDDTRTPGGELVLDTNIDQTGNEYVDRLQNVYGTNTGSTADTLYTPANTGLSDRELSLYGGNNDRAADTGAGIGASQGATDAGGYADWEQNLYNGTGAFDPSAFATSTEVQGATDDLNNRLTAFDPAAFAASAEAKTATDTLADRLGSNSGTSSITEMLSNAFNDLVSTVKEKGKEAVEEHPGRTLVDVVGSILTGIPGLGKAGEKAIEKAKEYVTGGFDPNKFANSAETQNATDKIANILAGEEARSTDTGLTDRELALYGGDVANTTSDASTATNAGARATNTYNPYPGFIGYGSPGLGNSFTGIGDMNAINFLTGGIGGSPTSMIDPASMASYVSASEHGDTYAPGETFASMNKDLYDYAASHPVTAYDPFAENRNQWFADHPEYKPQTQEEAQARGATVAEVDKQNKAQNDAYASHQTTPEEQQAINDYYNEMYGLIPMAAGGIASLPEYKAGGLLKGPGDGMSDSIPAVIKGQQPQRAALADGEFVIPADVVSHLGNGSTDAGSDVLYDMMDRIRKARTGNPKQGKKINPNKFMPV